MPRCTRIPVPRPPWQRLLWPACLATPALLLPLLIMAGCGGPRHLVPDRDIPGFTVLQEDLTAVDPSPLQGRRILLDPGHGGRFRGALGPNGLAEADVNLGVALYLRGMLEWAGAEVFMTRTSDHGPDAAGDSTLAADLAFRVFLADSLQPDVFVSIHHNSNPDYDPVINETQTYYRLGDEGASLELAQAIHRHLAANLEITPARLLPGNFHVLRNVAVPAVLGEPAMISNPVMAGRLSLAAGQRLEATAYFLGLVEYFAGGSPRWRPAQGDTVAVPPGGAPPVLSWTFVADDRPGPAPGPDPASFTLLQDGRPVRFALSADGLTVRWRPPATDRGLLLELHGRNLAGRTLPPARTRVQPVRDFPLRVTVVREAGPGPRAALVRWASPDGQQVPAGRFTWPGGFSLRTDAGTGGSALVADDDSLPAAAVRWRAPALPEPATCPVAEDSLPAGWRWRGLALADGTDSAADIRPQWRPRLQDWIPPADPRAVAVRTDLPLWLEAPGFLPLVDPAPEDPVVPRTVRTADPIWPLRRLLPGLENATIILDPRGGGTITDGITPLGQRGADLNLETARQAAEMLRGAGATVVLARGGDAAPGDPDKVLRARRLAATLYLVIGRSRPGTGFAVRHYPGSGAGTAWAAAAAAALGPLAGPDTVSVAAGSDYLLRHTHCPALVVELPPPASAAAEIGLASPQRARAEASALLIGIAGHLAGLDPETETVDPVEAIAELGPLPSPGRIGRAVWDGNFVWAPGRSAGGFAAGDSLSSRTATRWPAPDGRHVLEIHGPQGWQLWLLERDGGRWRTQLMTNGD